MVRKKIRRISCGCKKKATTRRNKNTTYLGRKCSCNIDTPKGKTIQVSEADIDWVVFS